MRTLVIGGARSGKSHAAETMLADTAGVTYVATAYPADHDPEWTARVAAHQARRPATWSTVETLELADLLVDRHARIVNRQCPELSDFPFEFSDLAFEFEIGVHHGLATDLGLRKVATLDTAVNSPDACRPPRPADDGFRRDGAASPR